MLGNSDRFLDANINKIESVKRPFPFKLEDFARS